MIVFIYVRPKILTLTNIDNLDFENQDTKSALKALETLTWKNIEDVCVNNQYVMVNTRSKELTFDVVEVDIDNSEVILTLVKR